MSESRICWWCGKALVRKNLASTGPLLFVTLRGGQRVHKTCQRNAEEAQRIITAQPSDLGPVDSAQEGR